MGEENGPALQPADRRATQIVPRGGVNPPLLGDPADAGSPLPRPWTLPPQGLAVFHGDKDAARLSHYFLPRLLLQGKRVLMLDGANCADPRLLERLARQRRVPFEQFSRQMRIARAFTCFQLAELIARLPRLLTDFPAEVLIVTAFPELYYDEDVRDGNAQVAFEQTLANLRRWARVKTQPSPPWGRGWPAPAFSPAGAGRVRGSQSGSVTSSCEVFIHTPTGEGNQGWGALPSPVGEGKQGWGAAASAAREPRLALAIGLFSSATTFTPSPARRRFFEKVCAAGSEVWQFNPNAEGKARLVCTKRIFFRNSLSP